jgi:hypothetical protein
MGRLLDEPGSKSSLKMKAKDATTHDCNHEDLWEIFDGRLTKVEDKVDTVEKNSNEKLDNILTKLNNVDKKVDIINAVDSAVNQNKELTFNKTTTEVIVICTVIGSVCTIIGMVIGFKIF